MYAVLETDGKFSGVAYAELTDKIKAYHTQYGQTFIEVDSAPVDIAPMEEVPVSSSQRQREVSIHEPDYGSPTPEQISESASKQTHRDSKKYLDDTAYLVLRKVETGEEIPKEVLDKRAASRIIIAKANSLHTEYD